MKFVRYNDQVAVIVKSGQELLAENPGSDLDNHLGLWFGEVNEAGRPIVYTIPEEHVDAAETVSPIYQH
ncbi:hypothetical protein [Planctomicrobium piriforme]|uniref:Uncharacterized protein n=1 Tax=Planctomicrobium piriforme TaxID=1576369 RepID=A0A1I3FD53_9PLAN|nr:hypothetical protein [Planctomicrobium piriforme]SFI09117.1 hypothetical protein SAMN05421753_105186 [Planctomicrobium piriforme]